MSESNETTSKTSTNEKAKRFTIFDLRFSIGNGSDDALSCPEVSAAEFEMEEFRFTAR